MHAATINPSPIQFLNASHSLASHSFALSLLMKLTKPFIQLPIRWIASDSSQTYIYQNEKKHKLESNWDKQIVDMTGFSYGYGFVIKSAYSKEKFEISFWNFGICFWHGTSRPTQMIRANANYRVDMWFCRMSGTGNDQCVQSLIRLTHKIWNRKCSW